MTVIVSSIMFVLLLAVAMAHFAWGLGKTWPLNAEPMLARTVIGSAGLERMPPRLRSLAVGLGALAAGVVAVALADDSGGGMPLDLLGLLLAVAFLARGVLGYTGWWARRTPEEPFRTLDRRNYSPLCLALGAGFLFLVFVRLT